MDSYLEELHEEGLIIKIKPEALEDREVVEIPLSEEGYYLATEAGREVIEGE